LVDIRKTSTFQFWLCFFNQFQPKPEHLRLLEKIRLLLGCGTMGNNTLSGLEEIWSDKPFSFWQVK
jgi:hypothetical protein